jgi:hypothetical protein
MLHDPSTASSGSRSGTILAALTATFVAASAPTYAQSNAPRGVVPVADFEMGLKRIEIEVDGVKAWVIFDTGAGITAIGADLAGKIGCKPYGQLSGVRMTGEVLTAPWCGPATITAGGVEAQDTLMYFDVASLLPPEWPHVDGIVSLNAFREGAITLDWPGNQLILESDASLAQRIAGLVGSPLYIQRDVAAQSMSVFFEVAADPQPLRILLDAGSAGGNTLAPHAFEQLGLDVPAPASETHPGEFVTVDLTVAGLPMKGMELQAQDIIYDGNFGARFLSQNVVTLDFASQRIWVAPR